MFDLPPFPPQKPAIVSFAEPWETRVLSGLAAQRVPLRWQLAIVRELKRILYAPPALVRATVEDLEKIIGGVALASAVPGMTGPSAAAGRAVEEEVPTFTFLSTHTPAGVNNFTFNIDVGAASPTLRVLIAYSGNANTRTFSSATIGGVSLALISDGTNNGEFQSGNGTTGFIITALPSDSGSLSFNFNWSGDQTTGRSMFAAYRMTGFSSGTAVDIDKQNVDNNAMTLTSVAGGVVVGAGFYNSTSNINAYLGGLVNDQYSILNDAAASRMAGGWGPTASTTITAGLDWTGSGTIRPQVYATFAP